MRHILAILLILSCLGSKAQLFPVYSQYLVNGLAINPAYAGSRDVLSASLLYRNQWVGFEGAPETMTFGIHFPFPNKALAAGLLIQNERIGISSNVSYYGNYAYRIRTKKGFLSFGLKAGFESSKENTSKVIIENSGDEVFEPKSEGFILPNFGAGVYYYNTKYFLGASLPEILSFREKGGGFEVYNNPKNYNFLFLSGMLINVSNQLSVKPSTLLRYHYSSRAQIDLNCNFILLKDGILWLGASYRSAEALVGIMELQLNPQFRFGYSYDYSTHGTLHNGSHEIVLRYEFRYIVKAINPKYF